MSRTKPQTLDADGQLMLKRRECRNGVPDRIGYFDRNGGVPTAGFGHTGDDVVVGKEYSDAQMDAWFAADTKWAVDDANAAITYDGLTQNQFNAFVSALYNTGPGKKGFRDGLIELKSGKPSTVLTLINSGDPAKLAKVPEEFLKWTHDAEYPPGGPGDPGLINRRNSEGGQWVKGAYVTGSGSVMVAKEPTIWQQAHTKLVAVGASTAIGGLSGTAITGAGQQLQTAAAAIPSHTLSLMIAATGVLLIIAGALWGMLKKS